MDLTPPVPASRSQRRFSFRRLTPPFISSTSRSAGGKPTVTSDTPVSADLRSPPSQELHSPRTKEVSRKAAERHKHTGSISALRPRILSDSESVKAKKKKQNEGEGKLQNETKKKKRKKGSRKTEKSDNTGDEKPKKKNRHRTQSKKRDSSRKRSLALDRAQDKMVSQMLKSQPQSGAPGSQHVQMTTGQLALMEKKQKLYKETQALPLWGIRKVVINPTDKDDLDRFPDNLAVSSKYTWYSFLPKNLIEQFHRLANLWFLFVSVLQAVAEKQAGIQAWATAVPLVILLMVTGCKDAWEDYRRHRNDRYQDNRRTRIVDPNFPHYVVETSWKHIRVGNVIQLYEDEEVPADLIVLASSNSEGQAYVDTIDLDGEAELKLKLAVKETRGEVTYSAIGAVRGRVVCEQPTIVLDSFSGSLKLDAHPRATPLDATNFILKGSKVKNTDFLFGVVVYTGKDTRINCNTLGPRPRRSVIDRDINTYILILMGIVLFLVMISVLAFNGAIRSGYLDNVALSYSDAGNSLNDSLLTKTITFIILFNNLIPISLMVTIDIVRFIQGSIIECDPRMQQVKNGRVIGTQARSPNLNETLGMVDFVFSDKTGTVTQNNMTFRMCVIGGRVYGLPTAPARGVSQGSHIAQRRSPLRLSRVDGGESDVSHSTEAEFFGSHSSFTYSSDKEDDESDFDQFEDEDAEQEYHDEDVDLSPSDIEGSLSDSRMTFASQSCGTQSGGTLTMHDMDGDDTQVHFADNETEEETVRKRRKSAEHRGKILKQVTFREKSSCRPKPHKSKKIKRCSHRHRTKQRRPSTTYRRQFTSNSGRSSQNEFRIDSSVGSPHPDNDFHNDENHYDDNCSDSHTHSTSILPGYQPSGTLSTCVPSLTTRCQRQSFGSTFRESNDSTECEDRLIEVQRSRFHISSRTTIPHGVSPPRQYHTIKSCHLLPSSSYEYDEWIASGSPTVPSLTYSELFVNSARDRGRSKESTISVYESGNDNRPQSATALQDEWRNRATKEELLPDLSPRESFGEGSLESSMFEDGEGIEESPCSTAEEEEEEEEEESSEMDDFGRESTQIDERYEPLRRLPTSFRESRKEISSRCHFHDTTIFKDLNKYSWRSRKIDEFIKVMALCNTVAPYVSLEYENVPEGFHTARGPPSRSTSGGRRGRNGTSQRTGSDHGNSYSSALLGSETGQGSHSTMRARERAVKSTSARKLFSNACICCKRKLKEGTTEEASGRSTEASGDPSKNGHEGFISIEHQARLDSTPQTHGWILQPNAAAVVQRRASVAVPVGAMDGTLASDPAMATSLALLRGPPRVTGHKMVQPSPESLLEDMDDNGDPRRTTSETPPAKRRNAPQRVLSMVGSHHSSVGTAPANISQLDTMASTRIEDSRPKTLLFAKMKIGAGINGSAVPKSARDSPNQRVFNFFRHAVWDGTFRDSILYQAYSPDEECLVSAASHLGYTLVSKTQNHAFLEIDGELRRYEILGVNGWSAQRKRMSVVLREQGSLSAVLYCKGADETILDILDEEPRDLAQLRRHISRFSLRGLRSLVLCCRYLSPRETEAFRRVYNDAKQSIYNKDERAEKVALEFEQNLELLGITGVRDKLQPGVPEIVDLILESGARIWLLTGDHPDYTIHVGYSSRLLKAGTVVFNADFEFPPGVAVRGSRAKKEGFALFERFKKLRLSSAANEGLCLVVTGRSLPVFLSHQELQSLFLLMTCSSDSVLCTRVTPAQKAQLVQIMKKRLTPSPVTLGIGDGANDVSMLQASHCGVAIMGSEGMEAVAASDFALPSFAYLRPLLFIHGRLNYMRMSMVILYFFFKSFLLVLPLFFFTPLCHWTGTNLYDSILYIFYNLLFTSIPIVFTGAAEWDIPERVCSHVPVLYALGRRRLYFNGWVVSLWFIEAMCWSLICFYFIYGTFKASALNSNGLPLDIGIFGYAVLTIITVAANMKLLLECRSYSKWWTISFVVIVLLFYPSSLLRGIVPLPNSALEGIPQKVLVLPIYWFALILILGATWLTQQLFDFLKKWFFSNLAINVAEANRFMEQKKMKAEADAGRTWKPDLLQLDPHIAEALRKAYNPFKAQGISSALPKPRHFQLTDNVLAYAPFLAAPGAATKQELALQAAIDSSHGDTCEKPTKSPHLGERVRSVASRLSISMGLYSPRTQQVTQQAYMQQFVDPCVLPGEGDPVLDEEISLASSSQSESEAAGHIGRVTGRLKVVKVSDLIRRFSLQFKDHQLEAEFQFMRKREYKKYSTWYRVVIFSLFFTMVFEWAAGLYYQGHPTTPAKYVSIVLTGISLIICCIWNFFDFFYIRLEVILLTLLSILVSSFVLASFEPEIPLALPCIFGTLTFVILRIPFTKAVLINISFLVAFIVAFLIYKASTSFLFLSLPHFLGIEGFTGFAGYRLEYNQRKRFLLNYQVEVARRKQREILNTMLPSFVVEKMLNATITKDGIPVDLRAEDRGTVTILFCDVYEFQNLVSSVEPTRLVEVLDSLFLCFDKCAEQFGCTKIETVFETYLCAAGLRPGEEGGSENPIQDAFDALDMALAMLEVSSFIKYETTSVEPITTGDDRESYMGNENENLGGSSRHGLNSFRDEIESERGEEDAQGFYQAKNSFGQKALQWVRRQFESPIPQHETKRIRVKIGIHSGRVISGVVGAKKPQYALFGDTVNTASRMKMTGQADHVHISEASYFLVKDDTSLTWEERRLHVKGKGEMRTYLLKEVHLSDYPYFRAGEGGEVQNLEEMNLPPPLRDSIVRARRTEARPKPSLIDHEAHHRASIPEQFRSLIHHSAMPPLSSRFDDVRGNISPIKNLDSNNELPNDLHQGFHVNGPLFTSLPYSKNSRSCRRRLSTMSEGRSSSSSNLLPTFPYSASVQTSDEPERGPTASVSYDVASDVSFDELPTSDQCMETMDIFRFRASQCHAANDVAGDASRLGTPPNSRSRPTSRSPTPRSSFSNGSHIGNNPIEGSSRKGRIQSALSTVQRSMRRVSVFQPVTANDSSNLIDSVLPSSSVLKEEGPEPDRRRKYQKEDSSTAGRALASPSREPTSSYLDQGPTQADIGNDRTSSTSSWPMKFFQESRKGATKSLRRAFRIGGGTSLQVPTGLVPDITAAERSSGVGATGISQEGILEDPVEELGFEQRASALQLYFFTLSFRDREQEEEYKHYFYNNKSNINTIEQSLIIFLVTFVLYTIMEIIFDGKRTVEDTSERFYLRNLDQYWAIRAAYTTVWFICWILFHYRARPEIQTILGVRWMTFFLNVTFISAACIFLISAAWGFTYESGTLKWVETDCFQLVFFITVLHHNTGLLFQHVILVNFLLLAMVFVFVQIVCAQTRASVYTLFLIFPFLFFNSLSAHHKENIDRLTWYVSEEMQTTEDRARELLNDMLPKQVLEEFQQDKLKLAYRHDRMTFLFADICGFTTYANSVDATEVVQMLQQLFARFDRDSTRFGLYKLCTIGDAYVAVSEPVTEDNIDWNPVEGAERVLEMANAMIDKIREVRDRLNIPGLNMRIGLHYGKCVGGVIGSGRLRYDLWGLDVLTGNMMESNGVPGKINVSEVLKSFLEEQFPDRFRFKFNKAVKVIDQVVNSYLLQDGAEEEVEKAIPPTEARAPGRSKKRRFSVLGMQFGGKKEDEKEDSHVGEVGAQRMGSVPQRGVVRRGSIARLFGRKEEHPPDEAVVTPSGAPSLVTPPLLAVSATKQQGPMTLEKLREMFQDINLADHHHDDDILNYGSPIGSLQNTESYSSSSAGIKLSPVKSSYGSPDSFSIPMQKEMENPPIQQYNRTTR